MGQYAPSAWHLPAGALTMGLALTSHTPMNIHLSLTPLISLIAGVLILVMPKLLNYIVAIYLIAVGLIGIFGLNSMQFR